MTNYPKWSTPERRNTLVKLFTSSGGFCVFGHPSCLVPSHHYEIYIESLIDDWKDDDRYLDQLERKALHRPLDRKYRAGLFGSVSLDIFHDQQPLYYLEGLGFDGLALQPFAKVRIGSSYMRLYVALGGALRGISKNKRRKALRYGKALPAEIEARVSHIVYTAVQDYLNS